ncbi:MAG TPA: hypothetical protein VGK04_11120 [Thermoanaerobaculia bacterium]|jgi:hypothetical protein
MELTQNTTARPFGAEFLEEILPDGLPFGCFDKECGDSSGYNTFTSKQSGSIDEPSAADD